MSLDQNLGRSNAAFPFFPYQSVLRGDFASNKHGLASLMIIEVKSRFEESNSVNDSI